MPIQSGVYRDLPSWSDSFNDGEIELIKQFVSTFESPINMDVSDRNTVDITQRIYRGNDERRMIIQKTKIGYFVITHYNNQYLNSYKLDDLSELYQLPNSLSSRMRFFV